VSEPFKPVGEKARWRYVVDWAHRRPAGATVTYGRLAQLMDAPNRHIVQAAVRTALPHLERDYRRTLEVIPGVGYRVADAAGHLRQSRTQRKRATRALTRSLSKVTSVDLNKVKDPELRDEIRINARVLEDQLEAERRASQRMRRREERLRILHS